jgi:hypothetical protein
VNCGGVSGEGIAVPGEDYARSKLCCCHAELPARSRFVPLPLLLDAGFVMFRRSCRCGKERGRVLPREELAVISHQRVKHDNTTCFPEMQRHAF